MVPTYEIIYSRRYSRVSDSEASEPAKIIKDVTSFSERIERSIRLSENYEINTDILLFPDCVRVILWPPYALYEGQIKQTLSSLISDAISLSFQADTQNPYRFILSLEFSR